MKICGLCNQTKDLSSFTKNKSKKDGLDSRCRDCYLKYQRKWYLKNSSIHRARVKLANRKAWLKTIENLKEFLENHPCVDCGEKDLRVLEFDHLKDKTIGVSILLRRRRNWETLLTEIEKCEVVCANCHKKRTYKRSGSWRNLEE